MRKLFIITKCCLAIFIGLALIACTKVTQENYNKIHSDMTTKEVIAILGEPTSSQGIDFAGVSGTSSNWKGGNAEISIIFFNDKVQIKSYNKSGTHIKSDTNLHLPLPNDNSKD